MTVQNNHYAIVFALVEYEGRGGYALSRATARSLIDLNLHVFPRRGATLPRAFPDMDYLRIRYPQI